MEPRKERAIKYINSQKVKSEVWLWIKIFVGCVTGIVVSLIFAPVIDKHVTSWHPFTQLGVTVSILLIIYFLIRRKTR